MSTNAGQTSFRSVVAAPHCSISAPQGKTWVVISDWKHDDNPERHIRSWTSHCRAATLPLPTADRLWFRLDKLTNLSDSRIASEQLIMPQAG